MSGSFGGEFAAPRPSTRDGDLPPGVYERMPDGTLKLSTKIFTPDPPRPLHKNKKGQITDITHSQVEFLKDEVLKHYELKTGHSLTRSPAALQRFREMCDRAADSVIRSNL